LIREKPVYSISEVALIPLSSKEDAEKAIIRARSSQQAHSATKDDFLTGSSDDESDNITLPDDSSVTDPSPEPAAESTREKATTIASDVIAKQGLYGRFADRWFSKKGWASEQRRKQGLSSDEDLKLVNNSTKDPAIAASSDQPPEQVAPAEVAEVVETPTKDQIALLPKILTTAKLFFGSKNFFFSYDYDLTRPISQQIDLGSVPNLHRSFDQAFYWNKYLVKPFIDAGQEEFAVPLIQGFVGQREFSISVSPDTMVNSDLQPETTNSELTSKSFLLTLISKRSVNRAGLRYLRRGIDEDGHAANSVETEQILSPKTWQTQSTNLYSYIQYRGSIPLFFSQSPYSLKPIPVVRGTPEANYLASEKHLNRLQKRYGRVQIASLVEKKGAEGTVGQLFEKSAERYISKRGDKDIQFEWFDFHAACKGMKFQNVSLLLDIIKDSLNSFGWSEISTNNELVKRQDGVLRTNCMDCLDRTNVVQSACGRVILEQQLAQEGVSIDLQNDPSTNWFNTLWADNGDAISRSYAGTAALKGDFTRTRKRNISGALTDFGLTLSRYYNNIVNDYFTQALIDFVLGKADETIFIDFEADMKSQDYAIDLRKVRQTAIETCSTICIEDPNESLIAGWVLGTPRLSGTLKSIPLEECVLLLTEDALYFCRLDWSTEKVKSFEKVDLDSVISLNRGTYITSTFASRDLDESKNVGFVVRWSTEGNDPIRINTRSLTSDQLSAPKTEQKKSTKSSSNERFLAFKALPPRSNYIAANMDDTPPSETELVKSISDEIARIVSRRMSSTAHKELSDSATATSEEVTQLKVAEEDVISLIDAKRSTGYIEAMSHAIKKMVWAS
jgi:hypothetical protein